MTFGLDLDPKKTDCPEPTGLTVSELLRLPAVLTGAPQIFATPEMLSRPIRWAHVLENLQPLEHLRGGELVLSTGIGWGDHPDFTHYAQDLAKRRVPALVLELGSAVERTPGDLIAACREAGLALIVMKRKVAFVEITGALHERLFTVQTRRIEAGGEVTAQFTGLMQRGAPTKSILNVCARLLQAPVFLEDQGYHLLSHVGSTDVPEETFASWHDSSRREHLQGNPGRYSVPVQLHGKRYGSLMCPLTAAHAAGVTHVLTMAAVAIGVDLMQRPGAMAWELGTGQQLLDELLVQGQLDHDQLESRFEAAGMQVASRQVRGFAIELEPGADPATAAQELQERMAPHRAVVAQQMQVGRPMLYGLLRLADVGPEDARSLDPSLLRGHLYLGAVCTGLERAEESINQAVAGFELQLAATNNVVDTTHEPLALLAHDLRHEPSLQRLPRQLLAPILARPQRERAEHLRVLEACLAFPSNRSLAARHLHLSRSVFYQRLAKLEQLLGMAVDDPRTFTVLSLALLMHRQGPELQARTD